MLYLFSPLLGACFVLLSGCVASGAPSDAEAPSLAPAAPPQVSPLEIHHINVQQGDCTLIIGPDGTTVLIDGGKPGRGEAEIVPYLASIGVAPSGGLDFMICTHRDSDHLGGLDEVIQAGYDVTQGIWDNGSAKDEPPAGTSLTALQGHRKGVWQWLGWGSSTTAGTAAGGVFGIELGEVIELGDGATATCVAVGGSVLNVGGIVDDPSENDQSVAILVDYGDFEYITAGDLGGGESSDDRACTGRRTSQADLETPLAQALVPGGAIGVLPAEGLEVLDVNHHGSESSTNATWMNLLSPAVAVINTGPTQGSNFHHPREDVVEQVLMGGADCITAPPALVLQTEEGFPQGASTSFDGYCVGDVVIKTTGVGTFEVTATGRVGFGEDERDQAGLLDGPRIFQLDGVDPTPEAVVITEIMRNPADVSDNAGEWFELLNPGTTPVSLEGWTIRDDDTDAHVIDHAGIGLVIDPGQRIVLGRNGDVDSNGGVPVDYVYSKFNLANGTDELVLVDTSGEEVDRVAYTSKSAWATPAGASLTLVSPSSNNDDPASWQPANARGSGYVRPGSDLGSPGGE